MIGRLAKDLQMGELIPQSLEQVGGCFIKPSMKKQDILILSAVNMVDLPDGDSVILQAHEALYLTKNKYAILSSIQMREHGVAFNDTAKRHDGPQNRKNHTTHGRIQ